MVVGDNNPLVLKRIFLENSTMSKSYFLPIRIIPNLRVTGSNPVGVTNKINNL